MPKKKQPMYVYRVIETPDQLPSFEPHPVAMSFPDQVTFRSYFHQHPTEFEPEPAKYMLVPMRNCEHYKPRNAFDFQESLPLPGPAAAAEPDAPKRGAGGKFTKQD